MAPKARTKGITKAGLHVLVPAPTTGGSLEVLAGQFSSKSNVNVTFAHTDPPVTFPVTAGRDVNIPTGVLDPNTALTMETSVNAQITVWVQTRVVDVPPTPIPIPDPVPPVVPTIPPSSGGKRVLTGADFVYLGGFRLRDVDMTFHFGNMTGRKVNGSVHLFFTGNVTQNSPLYEFAAPTSGFHATPAQSSQATWVRDWGTGIFGNARTSWAPDGSVQNTREGAWRDGGLHFNESTGLLYWTFFDAYNTSGYPNWCLGATRLSDGQAFGPWRPAGGTPVMKGPWRCLYLSAHPSGAMLCGSTIQSGAIGSPWGPDLWAGAFPTVNTPSGLPAPDIPIEKFLTYYPMYGRVLSNGTWTGPLNACRRTGDYFFEPFAASTGFSQIDPAQNGGVGTWTELDGTHSVQWIDLPDAHGVVFVVKQASGHVWYANNETQVCTHGVTAPILNTGPVSTDAYPAFFVYDPAHLDAIKAGSTVDYTVLPTSVVKPTVETAAIDVTGAAKTLGGSYFDPDTRKLYVCAPQADRTVGGIANPFIHVWQIA